MKDIDGVIFAVPHDEFKSIKLEDIKKFYDSKDVIKDGYVLIDVKGMFDRQEAEDMEYIYWRL